MKTGRPTYQLDANRLRQVREEENLTQASLAEKAYSFLPDRDPKGLAATKHYQKIERTGRTSKAMAEALAKALGTTVGMLQGEAPDDVPNWIESLERQLRDQIETGANPVLQAALARESDTTDPVRHLAVQIAERLEYVQLGPQRGELVRLMELTGWTAAQLVRATSLHGHWFLMSTVNGMRSSAVVLGASEVLLQIRQSGAACANVHESDVTITLHEELPWLRLEVKHPRFPARRCTFSFVRCRPTQSGLDWANPTWRDRFWLDEPLLSWAFTHANFVVGFDGHAIPRDVRALRLLVEKSSVDQTVEAVAVVKGVLEELPDDILDSFRRKGSSHDLAINSIATGLWDALSPLIEEWPADRWHVQSGAYIVIGLNPLISWGGWSGRTPDFGVKYQLRLIEEIGTGPPRSAPWRKSSVEQIAKTLRDLLRDEADRVRAPTAPRASPPPG